MLDALTIAAEAWTVAVLAVLASVPIHQVGWIADPVDAALTAFCVTSWAWLMTAIARVTP